jgi:hypothetical protein
LNLYWWHVKKTTQCIYVHNGGFLDLPQLQNIYIYIYINFWIFQIKHQMEKWTKQKFSSLKDLWLYSFQKFYCFQILKFNFFKFSSYNTWRNGINQSCTTRQDPKLYFSHLNSFVVSNIHYNFCPCEVTWKLQKTKRSNSIYDDNRSSYVLRFLVVKRSTWPVSHTIFNTNDSEDKW